MEDKETRKAFMKLLNRHIKDLKSNPSYYSSREILNITDNSKYVIDPQMLEYDNDNRKDTKEENALINAMRGIGRRMGRTTKDNYGSLYIELNNHPAFKKFFNDNNINKNDMQNFGGYLLQDYQTKESEKYAKQKQQQQVMKQENETLKEENQNLTEENKKKDKKIERRDRRLERSKQRINDLTEQRDKLEENLNQMKEQHEKETQRIKNYYEKKTDEMTKQHEEEKAKLMGERNQLIQKYKTKYQATKTSMGKEQFEKEKAKITKELQEEMQKEIKEYENKIIRQEIEFKETKKSIEEAQRLSLQEIDNKLKEKEEEIMNLNKQIEDERKQAEEDKRKIKADANRDKIEKVAQMKNKMEDRQEKKIEETLEEAQKNQKEIYGFTPTLEAYIKKKLAAQAYSLDEDELIEKIARDIGKPGGLSKVTDTVQVAKAIYNRGAEETIKHIKKIANLAILTGYNHDLYNKLPGDVAQEVQRYITDKINDDIRKKNIKYILPKDKPRWEHAVQSKQLNPMLGRSAWRVN